MNAQIDSLSVSEETQTDSVFEMTKSPWGAVLRSAIIPGLGQIYNESYWKVPVILGVTGWFVYLWLEYDKDYRYYRNLYIISSNERHKELRTGYRDLRDEVTIYMGLVYLLNLVDAYVDAHLFDFTVEENFHTRSPMLNIRIGF
ncbi:MAG: hypothetical protein IPM56_08360 [Ignavibacteriales bacterium]|nr:MAG: hypothetical protein IPM56_08360 [Ignavibacteriales bacterium]